MTRLSHTLVAGVAALTLATAALTAQSPAPLTDPTPPATTSADCPPSSHDTQRFLAGNAVALRAPHGALTLVAVTDEVARARGLMCVVRIPIGRGMIFVFPPPDTAQNFWMKNTLVALDMVFVDGRGVVTAVAANIPPTPAGTPDDRVARRDGIGRYVIELGAGDARRHGIVVGTKFTLPALRAQVE